MANAKAQGQPGSTKKKTAKRLGRPPGSKNKKKRKKTAKRLGRPPGSKNKKKLRSTGSQDLLKLLKDKNTQSTLVALLAALVTMSNE